VVTAIRPAAAARMAIEPQGHDVDPGHGAPRLLLPLHRRAASVSRAQPPGL